MVSYANQNEASPFPGDCELRNFRHIRVVVGEGVSYAGYNEASPSLGAASCETDASFGSSWEAQSSGVRRKPEGRLAVPGGREPPNRRHVRGLLGGPAEWCHTKTTMKTEAAPSLGAANCETVATFMGSWEAQRNGVIRRPESVSGVVSYADQKKGLHVPGS